MTVLWKALTHAGQKVAEGEVKGHQLDRELRSTWASPVIAVPSGANGHIEVHLVIDVIGLGLPQVPLDA